MLESLQRALFPPTIPASYSSLTSSLSENPTDAEIQRIASHSLFVGTATVTSISWVDDLLLPPLNECMDNSLLDIPQDPKNILFNLENTDLNFAVSVLGDGIYYLELFTGVTLSTIRAYFSWVINSLYDALPSDVIPKEYQAIEDMFYQCKVLNEEREELDKLQKLDSESYEDAVVKVALKRSQTILSLSKGKTYSMYVGTFNIGGNSGIAILDFEKNGDDTYDVVFHRSCYEFFRPAELQSSKLLSNPLVHYKSVPENVLFFGKSEKDGDIDPTFLQAFIELALFSTQHAEVLLNANSLNKVLSYIEPYMVPNNAYGQVTGARNGSAFKIIPSWIRKQFKKKHLYKEAIFIIKLKTLILMYQKLQSNLVLENQTGFLSRYILSQAARKLYRRIRKHMNPDYLPKKYFNADLIDKAMATVAHILHNIANYEMDKAILSSRGCLNLMFLPAGQWSAKIRSGLDGAYNDPPTTPSLVPFAVLNKWLFKNNTLQNRVKYVQGTLLSIWGNKNQIALFEIYAIVENLHIPAPHSEEEGLCWVSRCHTTKVFLKETLETLEQKQATLDALNILLHLYTQTPEDYYIKRLAVILPISAVIHYLALSIDKELGNTSEASLMHYNIPFDEKLIYQEGLSFPFREDLLKVQQAMAYFMSFKAYAKDSFVLFEHEEKKLKFNKTEFIHQKGNTQYWRALIDHKNIREVLLEAPKEEFLLLDDALIKQRYEEQEGIYNKWLKRKKAVEDWTREGRVGEEPEDPFGEGKITEEMILKVPPVPLMRVNPSFAAQCMLLLEKDASVNPSLLDKAGYGHVNVLRRCYEVLNILLRYGDKKDLKQRACVFIDRRSIYNYKFSIKKYCGRNTLKTIRGVLKGTYRAEVEASWAYSKERRTNEWEVSKAQGLALFANAKLKGNLQSRIEQASSQWEIAPHLWLYEAMKEIRSFDNVIIQNEFFQLFLRCIIEPEAHLIHLGLGELILHDKVLRDSLNQFISKGLFHFSTVNPNIEAAGFFFELGFYTYRYLWDGKKIQEANTFNRSEEISKWLEKSHLSEKELCLLYFYKCLFTSKTLAMKDICTLFSSWMAYKFYEFAGKENISKMLLEYVERNIYVHIKNIKPGKIGEFGKTLFESLPFSVGCEPKGNWEIPSIGLPYIQNGGICFELSEGAFFFEGKRISKCTLNARWYERQDFIRIFGLKPTLNCTSEGDAVRCIHPEKGTFLIWQSDFKLVIQRYFEELGEVLQYEEPSSSNVLTQDFLFWKSKDSNKWYLTSSDDLKLAYIQEGGVVKTIDQKYVVSHPDPDKCEFCKFEDRKNILLHSDEQNTVEIVFQRYTSQNHNALVFKRQEDCFLWNENAKFALMVKHPTPILGAFDNYLFLTSLDRTDIRILIPFQPLVENGNALNYILEITNEKPLVDIGTTGKKRQKGAFIYFTYAFENGILKPTTIEAKFFLAYIYITQTRNEEVLKLVKSKLEAEKLTPTCLKIIRMILAQKAAFIHPDSFHVLFYILILYMKEMDKVSHESILEYFTSEYFEDPFSLYRKYIFDVREACQTLHNISVQCRLSSNDEIFLYEKLIVEGEEKAKKALLEKRTSSSDLSSYFEMMRARIRFLESNTLPKIPFTYGKRREDPLKVSKAVPIKIPDEKLKETDPEVFKNQVKSSLGWLKQGKNTKLCTTIPRSLDFDKNGAIFREFYKIATEGTIGEQQKALFKLFLWKNLHISSKLLDLYIVLMSKPSYFPKMVDVFSDSSEKVFQFIKAVNKVYIRLSHEEFQINVSEMCPSTHKPKSGISYPSSLNPSSGDDVITTKKFLSLEHDPGDLLFPDNASRWELLKSWKTDYMEECESPMENSEDIHFQYNVRLLSKSEQPYAEVIEQNYKALQADYHLGKGKNRNKKFYQLKEGEAEAFLASIQQEKEIVKKERESREIALLKAANASLGLNASLQSKADRVKAGLGGNVISPMTLADCKELLLSSENGKSPWHSLANQTLELMDWKSYESQLNRLEKKVSKLASSTVKDSALCYEIAQELDSSYYFKKQPPDIKVAYYVFAGESGMLPYGFQVDLVAKLLVMHQTNKGRFKDTIIQLIMGGGKTALIAVLVLYLTTRLCQGISKPISILIVLPALLKNLQINLGRGMFQIFGKKVIPLDYSRADLTDYNLKKIRQCILDGSGNGDCFIGTLTTFQNFELELFSIAKRLRDCIGDIKICEERQVQACANVQRWEALQKHLHKLGEKKNKLEHTSKLLSALVELNAESMHPLLDEVDQLLHCLFQVNFPEGGEQQINMDHNLLLLFIYKQLVRKDLFIPTLENKPSLAEVVRLEKDEQNLVSYETYYEHIIPVLAQELADNYSPIRMYIEGFQEPFIRYLTGKMAPELQKLADGELALTKEFIAKSKNLKQGDYFTLQDDLEFLNHLKKYEKLPKSKPIIDLIGKAKHLLRELLFAMFSKCARRDYAPTKDGARVGEIVRYNGVDNQAKGSIGYNMEAACYFYQWGASYNLSEKSFLKFAQFTEDSARYYSHKNGEIYEETIEYKEFKKTFGITLDEAKEPEKIEQILNLLSNDVEKRLEVQFEFIMHYVVHYPRRLSSTQADVPDLFASLRGMSAITWPANALSKRLADGHIPDRGTSGQISHATACKVPMERIFTATFQTIEELLDGVFLKFKEPHRIKGMTDTGGLSKKFEGNFKIAYDVVQYLIKRQKTGHVNPAIKNVVFFHADPGEVNSDIPYVWRFGQSSPERIGDTSEETFYSMGLEPGNYFVIKGELHSTGVDIPNSFDAVYILTYMKGMLKDRYEQGLLRLRKYFFQQDRVIVMTPETLERVINQAKTEQDFSDELAKTQSIHQAELYVRYFLQHIAHVVRGPSGLEVRKALKNFCNLKEMSEEQFCQAIDTYYPFLVTTMEEDTFLMHGGLTEEEDTKEVLTSLLENLLKKFEGRVSDKAVVEKAREEKEELVNRMEGLPKRWKFSNHQVGIEQEIAIQEELSVELNVSVEDSLEIEFNQYITEALEEFIEEDTFEAEHVVKWINALLYKNTHEEIHTVKQQLSWTVDTYKSVFKYHTIFSENLFGTSHFFNILKHTSIPVFSPSHRPVTGVLVVQKNENDFRFMLLSLLETNMARMHLTQLYESADPIVNNVWLTRADGSPLVIPPKTLPLPEENLSFLKGIFEINVFDGNIDYLEKMYEDAEIWLLDKKELKLRYLQLKTMRNDFQKDILKRSFFSFLEVTPASSPFHHVFQKRQKMEAHQKGKFIPQSIEEVKLLLSKSIYHLNVNYVQHLGIKLDSQDPLDINAIKTLAFKKGLTAESDIKKEIERHVAEQFNALRSFHIPFLHYSQMHWLPLSMVKYIEYAEQIFSIEEKEGEKIIVYHLSKEQVLSLEDHQIDLIPYTNPAFYPFFSQPWQIQGVPMEHLDKVNPEFLHMLSKKQIRTFDASFGHIIRAIVPRQVPEIHGNLLRYIDPAHYGRITEKQIRQITDRTLIKDLEVLSDQNREFVLEGMWTSWIRPAMCQHIDIKTQLKYLLKEEQIQAISDDAVTSLDSVIQVPKIGERQAPLLFGYAQIQACPKPFIHVLTEAQMPYINAAMVPFLRGKQVGVITDPKLFKYLIGDENPASGLVNQFQWIEKTQFSLLENQHIHSLKNNTLLEFANWVINTFCKECKKQALEQGKGPLPEWEIFADELMDKQIETFDSQELMELLLPWQIKTLRNDQVHLLQYPWQIKACSKLNIPYLKGMQIPHIPLKKVVSVNVDQAAYLTADQLIYIRKHDLALWKKIEPKVIPQQVFSFDTQEKFDQLSLPLLKWMRLEQVKFLKTTEQVNACPIDFFPKLDKAQVRLLEPEMVQFIDDKQVKYLTADQLKRIKKSQYDHITNKQVSLLDPDQLLLLERRVSNERMEERCKYITPAQIEQFSWKHVDILRADHINALPKTSHVWGLLCPFKQVKLVEPQNVNRIRKDHIKHITNPKAIRKLKDNRVKYLTASQHKMRTWEQWIPYMLSTVILGIIAFIPSMIARTTFVSETLFNTCPIRGCKAIKKLDKYPRRLRFLFCNYFF